MTAIWQERLDQLKATIEAETPLNEKTVTLAITEKKREILISRPSGTPGPDRGQAHVAIDAGAALLFDRATGNRIAPASAAAKGEPA